jgi:hypothetical protein
MALAERGFVARGKTWVRDGLQASFEHGWFVLRTQAEREQDLLVSDADWPGLWRLVPVEGGLARVFELPPTLARLAAPSEHAAILAWALASCLGTPGSGLASAEHEETQGWSPAVPGEETVVRAGALLAQIEPLAAGAGFELPLSARSTADLAAGRASWLRELLLDARARLRLARFLLVDGVPSARIDLRGAPPELQDDLAAAALDALRHAGAWLLEPLDLVLDPSLSSPALDAGAPDADRPLRRAPSATTRRARPAPSQETSDG